MNDILQIIAENKRKEVKSLFLTGYYSQKALEDKDLFPVFSLKDSILSRPGGIIAEFKRRSPSKGEISPTADVGKIIPQYKDNGAAAFSILTDTRFFGGAITDLTVARTISEEIPILRKDFIVSPLQIEEARKIGASAILLIAAILTKEEIKTFNDIAHSFGMETLIEIHDLKELDKITFEPDLLGVNNRNLSSFVTNLNHSVDLIPSLPKNHVLIAESGIKSPEDLKRLKEAGFSGFLIGEALMASSNPGETLKKFIDAAK